MSLEIEYPTFHHPEVIAFYEHDLSIPKEKVAQILQLPRATLIKDMETILMDFIKRNDFFSDYPEEDHWWSQHFHALWVLEELRATEALPTVLELLNQESDFGWHWFGDYTTEDFWEVLYHLGKDQLEELKKVVLRAGNWTDRIMPATTVEQIALHHPERRQEVVEWCISILDAFLAMEEGDKALKADVITSVISHAISFRAKELLPQVKMVDDRNLLDYGFAGDFKAIVKYMEEGRSYRDKRKIDSSIFDRYEDAMSWHSYQMKYDEAYKKKHTYKPSPPVDYPNKEVTRTPSTPYATLLTDYADIPIETVKREGKKVGRNDPCPCGSGKKHKKCCLRK